MREKQKQTNNIDNKRQNTYITKQQGRLLTLSLHFVNIDFDFDFC